MLFNAIRVALAGKTSLKNETSIAVEVQGDAHKLRLFTSYSVSSRANKIKFGGVNST